jgi:CubicO group peptidase (beta-lactamase class C family)
MSKGYLSASKKPRDFEWVQAAPAGALTTTAADMTRFMLAFLQDGAVDGVSILKPETVRQMETRQFEFHPMLPRARHHVHGISDRSCSHHRSRR